MNKNHLKDRSRGDRIEILSANAVKREEFNYFKPFTEDELNPYKERYFACKQEVDLCQASLDRAKEQFKHDTAEPKAEMTDCYLVVKAKGKQVSEEVYLIPDQENGIMEYVNESGEVVFSRRLQPTEKQLILKVVNE